MKRTMTCFNHCYDPGFSDFEKAAMFEDFVRALTGVPAWAMHRAFDEWIKTMRHRPCPADIVKLAQSYLQEIVSELADRRKIDAKREEAEREASRERVSGERAIEIMKENGFYVAPQGETAEASNSSACAKSKNESEWQKCPTTSAAEQAVIAVHTGAAKS